ncbi:DUF6855 family protein [Kribbella sp. NPDC050820]|uniref:DUF6855 family protein n=1 Tax=Kribbella sp. NPDC050820 TaxID=3155408 RepID=UPI0033D34EAB
MYRDTADPAEIVCQVGSTKLRYLARCLDDVPTMLKAHGDWMELGSADEGKAAKDGTLEAWARAADNPVGGWYGLRKGYRGRFAMCVPPLLEHLGLVELEHNPATTASASRGKLATAPSGRGCRQLLGIAGIGDHADTLVLLGVRGRLCGANSSPVGPHHLMARALGGEPTPPRRLRGLAVRRNS